MGAPPEGGGGGSAILGMLPFVLMFAVLYLLILRPQIKKQKAHQKMVDELKKGDEVVTSGGIHGVVVNLKDDIVVLKIAENVKVDLSRSAVATVKSSAEGQASAS
ncbi:MAG: preprotein translocase subunit YajC [Candidatus Latescibacteria bacterium]|nr:preprotein translocase subunit YajC [Candidatus Latescibacterota bacterium]